MKSWTIDRKITGMKLLRRFVRPLESRFSSLSLSMSDQQVREFSWLAGGQAASLLLSLVTIKLVTSIGPAGYGKFILATSIGGMLSLAFFGPLEQGYVRMYFYYGRGSDTRKIYFDSLLRVLAGSTGILLLAGATFVAIGHSWYGLDVPFHVAAAVMIVIAVLNVPLNGMMNAMRLRKEGSLIQIAERLCSIAALAATGLLWTLDATGVALCMAFATGISLLIRYLVYQKMSTRVPEEAGASFSSGLLAIRKEIYRKIAEYVQPFVAWGAISWVQSNGERWIIDSVMTKEDEGRYGLAASLVNGSVVVLINVLGQFVTPIIFTKFSSPRAEDRRQGMDLIRLNTFATFVVFVVFAVILYVGGEYIIRVLSTRAFTMDGMILLLLTLSLGLFYSAQSMTTVGLALNRPGVYMRAKIVAAVLSVFLFYVGCTLRGLFGIVVAMAIVNSVHLLLVVRANRKLIGRPQGSDGAAP